MLKIDFALSINYKYLRNFIDFVVFVVIFLL